MGGILFDLEGTLVESKYQKNPKFLEKLHQETKKYLLNQCIPTHIINKSDKSIILRNLTYDWAYHNLNKKDFNILKNDIEKFMLSYDMASAYGTTLYPDTVSTLTKLHKCNYKLGIVTNTSKKATIYMIKKHNIAKFFDTIITRSDVIYGKPNPEMLLLAVEKMNKNVEYLVGDSIVDAEAAKKASMKSIIIKRENKNPKYFYNYLITSLNQLSSIIDC